MRNLSLCVVLHDEIEWEIGRDEVTAKKRVKTHIYLSDTTNFGPLFVYVKNWIELS